ncbi:hypothetical protein LTR36_010248 [Oleoguttula mirabilis]|uniref:peptidylprolyl isomerase n=1 Tax=Oleoguttula mirabilis TaxID=1507867 RepID=A0AAV9JTQ6_9PEZI|nr:hypothetical protein LTR36_010248 [Oleoguttula mirabilis]
MAAPNRPRAFLDVNIGEQPAGRLTIELFADKTPKTCENFRQLCTGEHDGLSYAKAPLHRIIDEFMIQGGDIANGDGTGTTSIYGREFEDENLNWRAMDAAGLVCSANRGRDTNGSQFFITLEECPHLNGKHTIFGRIVAGQETLDKLAKVPVDKDDRPLEPVLIARCGELEKRKKKTAPAPEAVAQAGSADRGRRRKSDASDDEMEDTSDPQPSTARRARRVSDNVVDEGLRGRPRQRSGSRSVSRPLSTPSEQDEKDDPHSPVKKHKRKRSPSPSRHVEAEPEDGDDYEQRRRRSLPNQYGDERYSRNYGDEDRYRPSPRREDWYAGGRRDDRYRPAHNRDRHSDEGRLGGDGRLGGGGGGGYDDGHDPPIKFKGRGAMTYREPGRL